MIEPTEPQIQPGPETTALPEPLLVTVEEAARRLAIGRTLIYDLVRRRHLRSVRIGTCRRIPTSDLAAFVDELRGPPPRLVPTGSGDPC